MFSKTHNLQFFTMVTNKNTTKTQRRPQNTSKRAPKRTGTTQKSEETPKYHESITKVPLSLPEVLQNPQFTLFQHDDHGKPNETQWRPKNTSKTHKQEMNQKKKQQKLRNSHENHPKLTLSSPKPTIHTHLLYENRELNKTQRRPQNMSETPKQELHKKKKQQKLRNSHENQSKLT